MRATVRTGGTGTGGVSMTPAEEKPAFKPFYGSVLDEAELISAMAREGIDDEVAALRVRLRRFMKEHPEDVELMLKGMSVLIRAASVRYRMSAQSKSELAESLAAVMSQMGRSCFRMKASELFSGSVVQWGRRTW